LVLIGKNSDGNIDIFPAYYGSSCGGHTENSQNVFGDSYESLAGVKCPYCRRTAKSNEFNWPAVSLKKRFVNDRLITRYPTLKNLEAITNITPVAISRYAGFSRLTKIKLTAQTARLISFAQKTSGWLLTQAASKSKAPVSKYRRPVRLGFFQRQRLRAWCWSLPVRCSDTRQKKGKSRGNFTLLLSGLENKKSLLNHGNI